MGEDMVSACRPERRGKVLGSRQKRALEGEKTNKGNIKERPPEEERNLTAIFQEAKQNYQSPGHRERRGWSHRKKNGEGKAAGDEATDGGFWEKTNKGQGFRKMKKQGGPPETKCGTMQTGTSGG